MNFPCAGESSKGLRALTPTVLAWLHPLRSSKGKHFFSLSTAGQASSGIARLSAEVQWFLSGQGCYKQGNCGTSLTMAPLMLQLLLPCNKRRLGARRNRYSRIQRRTRAIDKDSDRHRQARRGTDRHRQTETL